MLLPPRWTRFAAFVSLVAFGVTPAVADYSGTPYGDDQHPAAPQKIPGPIFCAYYDRGGEGVAYHDTEAENQGSGKLNPAEGSYLNEFRRHEGLDTSYTKPIPDRESPCNRVVPPLGLLYVGWNEPGEWFRLTVETAAAGPFVADVLYTSQRGGTIAVDVDGQPAASFALTSTFDPAETIPWRQWHHWAVARDAFTVVLPRGRSVLTVHIASGGNLNLATLLFRAPGTDRPADILMVKTPSPAHPWRPFSADSPWNQAIPADAASDATSAALIDDFASRGPLTVNIQDWSVPVYFVDADQTPKHDVGDSRPGIYGAGFGFPRQIPIPADAVASPPFIPDSDNHLSVIDRTKNLEWGMWLAQKNAAGRWFTGLGAVTDLAGSGVAPPWFANRRELDSHRARASGFPLIAGLMRPEELRAGRIDHALTFAYDHCRSEFFIPPASTAQATIQDTANHRGIPMGGRIQLDPAWDVQNSTLSPAGKIIARALQRYGAYCGDYAGANVLYAENSPAAVAAWRDVLQRDEVAAVFTPDFIRAHFRVVAMGNLLPGQNLAVPPPYLVAFAAEGERRPAHIDQLTRTITIYSEAVPTRVHWIAYPASARVIVDGRAIDATATTLPTAAETTWQLAAPSLAPAVWRIVRAPAADESARR